MTPQHSTAPSAARIASPRSERRLILNEDAFHVTLSRERKRTERGREAFALIVVDTGSCLPASKNAKLLGNIVDALSAETRETDTLGWYKRQSAIGMIFAGFEQGDQRANLSTMLFRVSRALRENLAAEQFSRISISCHLFPDEWDHELSRRPSDPVLYPDILKREKRNRLRAAVKRGIDVFGSLVGIVLFSPLLLLVAIAIKLTSQGPVLFRQERVGQYGRPFVFLKFRSMHVNNDAQLHKEWFLKFSSGRQELQDVGGNAFYKLVQDPRVTPLGRFLRRTSIDELPQLFNVLMGDMSLVGPRPPIPYEVNAYQTWHRGRILEAKPGITGLWQVSGRSRVSFDDMVRLDLRYARSWSLWLDLKLLLRTPKAVIQGKGAF